MRGVRPPEQVQAAFEDVVRAGQDRERFKNEGQAYANDVVPKARGAAPRFEATSPAEGELMFEAGDGRVTRASALASHLPGAEESESGTGIPELRHVFFGCADHHGIYSEPTFQSILLRMLLRPVRRRLSVPAPVPQPLPA